MRYCVSDVHGEYDLFCRLLDLIQFNENDELFICGDILDKGPHSVKLARLVFSLPNIRCIVGNHEFQFLKFYDSLMQSCIDNYDEILEKLRAYFQDGHLLNWSVIDALEALPYFIEEKDFICVHAGISLDSNGKFLPLEKTEKERLVYDRNFKEPSVLPTDEKCVFFGHTPTSYITGKTDILTYPRVNPPKRVADYYKIHLDTGANLHKTLGCFCLDTLQTYYVKE